MISQQASELKAINFAYIGASTDSAEMISNKIKSIGQLSKYNLLRTKEELKDYLSTNLNVIQVIIWEKGFSGLLISEIIKEKDVQAPDLPVISLANTFDSQFRVECMNLGCSDMITWEDEEHLKLALVREAHSYNRIRDVPLLKKSIGACERRSKELIDHSKEAIAIINEGLYLDVNISYLEMFGMENEDDILSHSFLDHVSTEYQKIVVDTIKTLRLSDKSIDLNININIPNGAAMNTRARFIPTVFEEERCIQIVLTEERGNLEVVNPDIDPLTGLSNKKAFVHLYHSKISEITKGAEYTFLYLRIENLDDNLEKLAFSQADKYFKGIAELIANSIQIEDISASINQSDYVIMVHETKRIALDAIAKNIINKAKDFSISLDDTDIHLKTIITVGIHRIGTSNEKFDNALRNAKYACSNAKLVDGYTIGMYQTNGDSSEIVDAEWTAKITYALENDGFIPYFQPIETLHGESEPLYEIMLRLKLPNGEIVLPNLFIDIAERLNFIISIEKNIIERIVKSMASDGNNNCYSIKLSLSTLLSDGLNDYLTEICQLYNILPNRIILEIKDQYGNSKMSAISKFVVASRKSGFRILVSGIDKNGLENYKNLGVDIIKIDGSIFNSGHHNDDDIEYVKEIINHCKDRNTTTLVSFIEKSSAITQIYTLGVSKIQGNFLAPPKQTATYEFAT